MDDKTTNETPTGKNVFLIINQQITQLGKDVTRLGRQLENDIVFKEESISRFHAEIRYEPYLKREEKEAGKFNMFKDLAIGPDLIVDNMPGLSKELQEKLKRYKPATIAAASLIPGMTPAALSILILKVRQTQQITT